MSHRSRLRGARVVLRPDLLEDRVVPSFTAASIFTSALSNPGSVAVGDLNADGKPDVVVANGGTFNGISATGNNFVVLTNDGTGALTNAPPALTLAGGFFGAALPRGVAIVDVDGDGKSDIVGIAAE